MVKVRCVGGVGVVGEVRKGKKRGLGLEKEGEGLERKKWGGEEYIGFFLPG